MDLYQEYMELTELEIEMIELITVIQMVNPNIAEYDIDYSYTIEMIPDDMIFVI